MPEILSYGFMQRAVLVGGAVGILCAVVGVYVVLRGMAFWGAGVAHAAFGGVALGFALGLPPLGTAAAFCVLVAWAIGWAGRRGAVREDTAVGIAFSATMAFGILLIGLTQGYGVDLFAYLFGSLLAIGPAEVPLTLGAGVLILGLIGLFYKEFFFLTFDEEGAAAAGLPVGFLYYLLLTLMALTVVLALKTVGIVLVSALLVLPPAVALQWSQDFHRAMAIAAGVGLLSVEGGLWLSYRWNVAPGGTVVLLATALFLGSLILARVREG